MESSVVKLFKKEIRLSSIKGFVSISIVEKNSELIEPLLLDRITVIKLIKHLNFHKNNSLGINSSKND